MDDYYRHHRASVHRGVYPLAAEATDLFEGARTRDRRVRLHWPTPRHRLHAQRDRGHQRRRAGWGAATWAAGDRILVTRMEHHSNFVPWWWLAKEVGAELVEVPIDDEGVLRPRRARRAAARRARSLAVAHVSNVLGTINPVAGDRRGAPAPRAS